MSPKIDHLQKFVNIYPNHSLPKMVISALLSSNSPESLWQSARIGIRGGSSQSWQCQDFESAYYGHPSLTLHSSIFHDKMLYAVWIFHDKMYHDHFIIHAFTSIEFMFSRFSSTSQQVNQRYWGLPCRSLTHKILTGETTNPPLADQTSNLWAGPQFNFSSVLFPPFCRVMPEKVATGVADYNYHYPYYNYCACR